MKRYEIHARIKPNGLKFRIWDTINESYCTNEMTQEEARVWFLKIIMSDLIDNYSENINDYLYRAKITGSSGEIPVPHLLNSNWLKPR